MDRKSSPSDEVLALCERLIEGTLSVGDKDRLEQLVMKDPVARQSYVEYLHLHAELRAHADGLTTPPASVFSARRRSYLYYVVPATLAVATFLLWALRPAKPLTLATLTETQHARWEGTSLPTSQGARLFAGKLRLSEGLATVVFDSGARVTLEAPAELEILTSQSCLLHRGILIAHVPPAAIGFTVRSPNAIVIDHGTDFGVSTGDDGNTRVDVLTGMVEASHLGAASRLQLRTGQGAVFQRSGAVDQGAASVMRLEPAASGAGWQTVVREDLVISSAVGRGFATFIRSQIHADDVLPTATLLVKNTPDPKWQRKAYVGFDLGGLGVNDEIENASLTVSLVPTNLGFAALVPDAVFNVYGLMSEAFDLGAALGNLTWEGAPGNAAGGGAVDAKRTTFVGSFTVPQGASQGAFTVLGPALTSFLHKQRGRIATFVIVRETVETRSLGLVHGFAASHHPAAAPPTLRMALKRAARD